MTLIRDTLTGLFWMVITLGGMAGLIWIYLRWPIHVWGILGVTLVILLSTIIGMELRSEREERHYYCSCPIFGYDANCSLHGKN